MERKPIIIAAVALLLVCGIASQPASAQDCIPPDAVIDSATFSIYVSDALGGHTVYGHRITAPWTEYGVTWLNFGGAYDAAVEGSFVADGTGWRTMDVTSLVAGWINGDYPNYGLYLEQGETRYTIYRSSEFGVVADRPKLDICYTSAMVGSACITIQRPGSEQDGVADAYIWGIYPNYNGGGSVELYTGFVSGYEKETLVRFDWNPCDLPVGCRFTGGGVDTSGNWDHTLESGEMIRNGAGNLPEGVDRYQFGGQAGANTGQQPQPKGEWTHHQQRGPSGRFTFHGGTASAPAGTEIDVIRCSDPGYCRQARPAPAKQLDFDGIGTFKSIGKGGNAPAWEIPGAVATAEGKGNQEFDGTFHWFEVNIDDLGEPGGHNSGAPDSGICPSLGFGEKGAMPLGNCDCPDFYRITIYNGVPADDVVRNADGSIDVGSMNRTDVMYEVYGYIDGGNLQIHPPTGFDLQ
jgi:hypothetical protein